MRILIFSMLLSIFSAQAHAGSMLYTFEEINNSSGDPATYIFEVDLQRLPEGPFESFGYTEVSTADAYFDYFYTRYAGGTASTEAFNDTPSAIHLGFDAYGNGWTHQGRIQSSFSNSDWILVRDYNGFQYSNAERVEDILVRSWEVGRIFQGIQTLNGSSITHTLTLTDISPAPIPIPAAAWLLAAGLGTLGVLKRKRG